MRYRTRVSYKARHLIIQESPLNCHVLLAEMDLGILYFITTKIVATAFIIILFKPFFAFCCLCK